MKTKTLLLLAFFAFASFSSYASNNPGSTDGGEDGDVADPNYEPINSGLIYLGAAGILAAAYYFKKNKLVSNN